MQLLEKLFKTPQNKSFYYREGHFSTNKAYINKELLLDMLIKQTKAEQKKEEK